MCLLLLAFSFGRFVAIWEVVKLVKCLNCEACTDPIKKHCEAYGLPTESAVLCWVTLRPLKWEAQP